MQPMDGTVRAKLALASLHMDQGRHTAAERELGNLKRMAGVGSPNTRADASMVTIAAF